MKNSINLLLFSLLMYQGALASSQDSDGTMPSAKGVSQHEAHQTRGSSEHDVWMKRMNTEDGALTKADKRRQQRLLRGHKRTKHTRTPPRTSQGSAVRHYATHSSKVD